MIPTDFSHVGKNSNFVDNCFVLLLYILFCFCFLRYICQILMLMDVQFVPHIWGAIKKFSAWPSSVQNKIKIVFASYSSKAQNTTCTIWLLGYKYFVHFSGRQLFAFDMEKMELHSVMKSQFWPIRSFHCILCCFDSESQLWMHVSSWITSCEINFCWVTSALFEKFFRNVCSVLVLAFSTPSDRHCVHKLKCTKYLQLKSHIFACRVLSLATTRGK